MSASETFEWLPVVRDKDGWMHWESSRPLVLSNGDSISIPDVWAEEHPQPGHITRANTAE